MPKSGEQRVKLQIGFRAQPKSSLMLPEVATPQRSFDVRRKLSFAQARCLGFTLLPEQAQILQTSSSSFGKLGSHFHSPVSFRLLATHAGPFSGQACKISSQTRVIGACPLGCERLRCDIPHANFSSGLCTNRSCTKASLPDLANNSFFVVSE